MFDLGQIVAYVLVVLALFLAACNLEGVAGFSPANDRVAVVTKVGDAYKLYTTDASGNSAAASAAGSSFGTMTPHAAATGASTIDTLSPTPPVLCFPTLMPGISDRSMRSPEWAMASVSHAVSWCVIPLRTMAISSADA